MASQASLHIPGHALYSSVCLFVLDCLTNPSLKSCVQITITYYTLLNPPVAWGGVGIGVVEVSSLNVSFPEEGNVLSSSHSSVNECVLNACYIFKWLPSSANSVKSYKNLSSI